MSSAFSLRFPTYLSTCTNSFFVVEGGHRGLPYSTMRGFFADDIEAIKTWTGVDADDAGDGVYEDVEGLEDVEREERNRVRLERLRI